MVLSGQLNTGQGTQNEALKCIQIVSTGKNVLSSENDEGMRVSNHVSSMPLPFELVAREEKALGIMAQKFLMLFLTSDVSYLLHAKFSVRNGVVSKKCLSPTVKRIASSILSLRRKFFWVIRKTKSPNSVVIRVIITAIAFCTFIGC